MRKTIEFNILFIRAEKEAEELMGLDGALSHLDGEVDKYTEMRYRE